MSTEEDIRKASAKFYAGLEHAPLMAIRHRWPMCGHTIQTFPQCILLMR